MSLVPLGDAWQTKSVAGFLLELPGGDEHPPGDASQFWLGFGVLSVLVEIQTKGNEPLAFNWILDDRDWGISLSIRVNLREPL